ncbi:miro-1 [Pristionchus pacificus]|uniref:Mitochondrial Rho GTPase n=1 Tax=Pristionchus pacificus TaxID=54126 RepID=A0A2A6BXH6_PRIPA|nr:miro-1 [Pristionchus pacificus]|eukprot:PDM70566.1 miro-1 [Pristionchus pacificus]
MVKFDEATRGVGPTRMGSEDAPAEVRIALVGEDGVGKSSLLMSLLEDEFVDRVPPRVDKVLIPADVTPENVTTSITDYSSKVQDETSLKYEIKTASVICVVYDVNRDETIEKVTSRWLPLIREVHGDDHEHPVILVGNKSDGSTNHTDKVLPIMERWPEVETCVECSARTMKNVSEIFYYAQKAVVCPTRPLYNADEKRLTEKCKKALIRVFKICDRDNDGYLNDLELNEFQKLCFGIPLTSAAIEDVKRVVSDGAPDGIVHDSISLTGFLYLHLLFIERGRHETTWTVLRKFGYNENVKLGEEYLYPRITVPIGCSTELSPEGIQFVSALFEKYDEDRDACLSPSELANLFSVCPAGCLSKEILAAVETNERGWVTYVGYMAYWHMTTLVNVTQTLEQLAYLGFSVGRGTAATQQRIAGASPSRRGATSTKDAIRVTRERKVDLTERGTDRKVFQCLVVGAKDAGKTVFMQSLAGRGMAEVAAMGRRHTPYVINRITVKEDIKYLLLREVDVLSPSDVLSSAETAADVVCFLYDISNPESFAFCATVFLKYFYRTKTPCLMVATKVEREEVEQRWETQPGEFCCHHELPKPVRLARNVKACRDHQSIEKTLFAGQFHYVMLSLDSVSCSPSILYDLSLD